MSRLSRLVRVTQLSLGPDLFFITRTRHRPLLLTTARPDTLLKWRQISVSAITSDDGFVEVWPCPSKSGVKCQYSKKRTLPKELLRNVVVLTCKTVDGGTCAVYLVGTSYGSQESCREVQAVISHLRPQVVFLELCESRAGNLRPLSPEDLKVPTMSEMIGQLMRKQNPFRILHIYLFTRAATKQKVLPNSEFRVAYEEAKKWGIKVILGGRPYNVSMDRAWALAKLSLWHNKTSNDKVFPSLPERMIDEEEQYMSSTLLAAASQHSSVLAVPSQHRSVVAVVGKERLPGMKKYWMQPVEMEKLMEIPSTSTNISTRKKIVKSLGGVAAVGVAIVAGVYLAARI